MKSDIDIEWYEPWYLIESNQQYYTDELNREITEGHVLNDIKIVAIARREDNDNVLFVIEHNSFKYAVVHLSWSRHKELDKIYPRTKLFKDIDEWVNNCMKIDNVEYLGEGI